MTPLDQAHAAMQAAPEDVQARLAFYDRLALSELFLLLEEEPTGGTVRPRLFPVENAQFALVFDLEERLTAFANGPAPYAALSGRALAGMLGGQGIGLAVNPGDAPSAILIEAASVDWLAATLAEAPEEVKDKVEEVAKPMGLPEALLTALDARLAAAEGLAAMAYLVGAIYVGGRRGHLLAFVDPLPGSERSLARLVSEALTFSGIDAGVLDVAFFRAADPMSARLGRIGLRFDLPQTPKTGVAGPTEPGMDPERPPKLR